MQPGHRSLRILLAEDTPANQKIAVRLLEKRGHQVWVAQDGREALAVLEQLPIDLVLMDVHMPEMDGLQATIEIRKKRGSPLAQVPIVAVSAHDSRVDQEQCLAAGMDAFLSKPIDLHRLISLIEGLCGTDSNSTRASGTSQASEIDFRAMIERLDHDVDLFLGFVKDFWNDIPPLIERARTAIGNANPEQLALHCVAIEATLGTLDSASATNLARRLKAKALAADLLGAEVELIKLEEQISWIKSSLAAFCATLPNPPARDTAG